MSVKGGDSLFELSLVLVVFAAKHLCLVLLDVQPTGSSCLYYEYVLRLPSIFTLPIFVSN